MDLAYRSEVKNLAKVAVVLNHIRSFFFYKFCLFFKNGYFRSFTTGLKLTVFGVR